ncbi:DUF3499 domain-containing protein [Desertihabitans brevis]|uniref:DUF3499 domain-containing protein n=1 Tax=Desertihabitans brevis TaxID=2268447 RepID=A0A367YY27_9ACTN|nr:DUF3499 domain-containing protein [Desertihabitans brevis]RCK70740.1 DUF3499 domain-containing protein [Desertihabitans brevis]
MRSSRRCSRTGCSASAVATMTYVYADSTAVLGPLALRAEPGAYDLCARHAQGLSVPLGWEVIRLSMEEQPEHSTDDLLALADAVREVGLAEPPAPALHGPAEVVELARRGHLTVLADRDRRPD